MKYSFLSLVMICLMSINGQAQANAIVGKWMSTDDNLMVEVYKQGNEYKAKLLWFDDTDDKSNPVDKRLDTKNPDKALRSRKLVGINVLWSLHYKEDDEEWQDGTIYDSSSGKKWDAKAWLTKNGLLKVRGYWNFSLFGENMSFKRIK